MEFLSSREPYSPFPRWFGYSTALTSLIFETVPLPFRRAHVID